MDVGVVGADQAPVGVADLGLGGIGGHALDWIGIVIVTWRRGCPSGWGKRIPLLGARVLGGDSVEVVGQGPDSALRRFARQVGGCAMGGGHDRFLAGADSASR